MSTHKFTNKSRNSKLLSEKLISSAVNIQSLFRFLSMFLLKRQLCIRHAKINTILLSNRLTRCPLNDCTAQFHGITYLMNIFKIVPPFLEGQISLSLFGANEHFWVMKLSLQGKVKEIIYIFWVAVHRIMVINQQPNLCVLSLGSFKRARICLCM